MNDNFHEVIVPELLRNERLSSVVVRLLTLEDILTLLWARLRLETGRQIDGHVTVTIDGDGSHVLPLHDWLARAWAEFRTGEHGIEPSVAHMVAAGGLESVTRTEAGDAGIVSASHRLVRLRHHCHPDLIIDVLLPNAQAEG